MSTAITFDLSALLFNPELARRFNEENAKDGGVFDSFGEDAKSLNGVIVNVIDPTNDYGRGFWDCDAFVDSVRSLLIVNGSGGASGTGGSFEARINSRGEIVFTDFPDAENLAFTGLYIEPVDDESANAIRNYFGAAAYGVKSEIGAKFY